MKKILILLILSIAMFAWGETVWDGEDCETDSTTYQLVKNIKLIDTERISMILTNNGDTTSYYQVRFYSDSGYDNDFIYNSFVTATGDSLRDTLAVFAVDGTLIGQTVYNVTDKSSGTITKADTTVIEAELAGGTNNSWTTGDQYKVTRPSSYYAIGDTLAATSKATYELENYYTRMCLYLKKTTAADSTAEFRFDYSLKITE